MPLGKPAIPVNQIGTPCDPPGGAAPDPFYQGCYRLRDFVEGCIYFNLVTEQTMGCVVRRKSDGCIYAAPDWRFCGNDAFEVLWLNERRKNHGRYG